MMKIRNSLIKIQALPACLYILQTLAIASTMPLYTCTSQLPIVVLICSYNNQKWVDKNLDSVFKQEYDNFRVIYIDDCSQDQTASLVKSYINTYDLDEKIQLVCNPERCRKMKNIYNGIQLCDDQEIVVQLDGDDWFIDNQLFAHLNHIYQTEDVWLTYGSDTLAYAQPTPQNIVKQCNFRKEKWIYAPTRSFYAWLFKAIKLEDFIAERIDGYQGLFFPSADDLAFMYPMLEMAGKRFEYIPTINYHVNTHNPLSNKKIDYSLQTNSSLDIRSRLPYQELTKPNMSYASSHEHALTDILIVSDNAHNLQRLIASLNTFVTGSGHTYIMYAAQHDEHVALERTVPNCTFVATDIQNIPEAIKQCIETIPNDYLLITHTNVAVTKNINLHNAGMLLEQTGAYGFYFGYSADQAPCTLQHLFDDVHVWKFACAGYAFHTNRDMTLLRKKDLLTDALTENIHAVGLCLESSVLKGTLTNITTTIDLPTIYPTSAQPIKKRRLHNPRTESRTKKVNKSNKSKKKENLS